MSDSLSAATALPAHELFPVLAADGARAELLLQRPASEATQTVYWLPALGVAAKHYLPLAQALAERGIAVAIHEWRGIGSSDKRADRHQDWGYRQLLEDDIPAGIAALRARLPRGRLLLGGHSLGGQLAALYASVHPRDVAALLVVASGSPYWRQFPQGRLLWLAYASAPWLARLVGHLPGRRIGFGGNEARQLIDDWARTGRTGRYAAAGMAVDFEALMGQLELPIIGVRMHDDWLAPQASLSWLLGKMPRSPNTQQVMTAGQLGIERADHFGWMKAPEAVAMRIAQWLHAQTSGSGT
ncbi:alpha/beta hydrolase family protein [Dyella kyungheensis]|uniref:Alpha/beta fold hydrolase n=1 Tax=Dyella kyungheensis TaxID=1242174 RepID=A0ABS2JKU6_9GAMM|nr:alpha/beta fold hydrolase [Dyella kyungheensis]MBM7119669.1 alpha/beta fold hydrolase [Dyella kyungheensis]